MPRKGWKVSVAVVKPGLLTTLQDAGRPGFAHLGVGRAGAFDRPALRIGNALVGNVRDACAIEITLLGPTLRFDAAACVAVTGAPIPFSIDGVAQPTWAPVHVPAGAVVSLGSMPHGCRGYLAVRGGFDVAPVLGSRSSDANAALGPFGGRPLRAGDTLAIAEHRAPRRPGSKWRLDPRPWFADDASTDASDSLRLLPGRHLDAMEETSRISLFSDRFVIDTKSNRVGVRLAGPRLEWATAVEMVSEGCVPGVLQLPPSGEPIAFGPECPVSGGYPRIGQVAAVDIPKLAQLRPGVAVRFRRCTFEEALAALRARESGLQALEATIAARLKSDA